ncbi:MAG: choice-of-anchor Q domain-containing protein [Marinicellaceae bacterium]
MLNKSIISLCFVIAFMSHASDSISLAEAKKVLSKKEYLQYTHEVWQKERKKAVTTNYSELLLNKSGAILTAGPGADCDFPNILTAINFAAPGNTILVADGTYTGAEAKLTINKDLSLVGGWSSNCQGNTGNKTKLQLDETGAVVTIDVSGGKNVTISGFDISGSQSNNQFLLTSGIHATGDGTVTVRDSRIHNNEAFLGGGISAINGVTLNISENTEIYSNSATGFGGGIYCNQSTLNIIDTKIGRFDNGIDQGNVTSTEDSFGGGIAVIDCPTVLGDTPIGIGPVEINYNKSDGGSGIYSENSPINFSVKGSKMSFNESNGLGNNLILGSAIWAQDAIEVNLVDIELSDNIDGTALMMEGNVDLYLNSTCSDSPCMQFLRNQTTAIIARDNTNVIANKIMFKDNIVFGLISNQGSGNMTVNNSVISKNQSRGGALITSSGSGEVNLNHVSIISNFKENGLGHLFSIFNEGIINVNANVIWGNTSMDLISELFPVNIINSIIQYNPAGYPNTLQTDPLLNNESNGDFHLKFGSPAIDHVNEILFTDDIEGDSRQDGTTSDAGADEWTDLIFTNDFEDL